MSRVALAGLPLVFAACAPTDTSGLVVSGACAAATPQTVPDGPVATEPFSFFVASLRAMQSLSACEAGFGGDLRYGETGAGAGLRGADKICSVIAEGSMTGAGHKPWRAFLSASAGGDGQVVHAIDRVGSGPWYDRLGRRVSADRAGLLGTRPAADTAIAEDLPNEDGVPNSQPDLAADPVDNHDVLTGSNASGQLASADATCLDWTAAAGEPDSEGTPQLGHSWPHAGGGGRTDSWIAAHRSSGCAPGINLIDTGGPSASMPTVGSGGGYGAIYCFALVP